MLLFYSIISVKIHYRVTGKSVAAEQGLSESCDRSTGTQVSSARIKFAPSSVNVEFVNSLSFSQRTIDIKTTSIS